MKPFQFINAARVDEISEKLYSFVVKKTDILEKKWQWNNLKLPEVLSYVPELEEECKKLIPAAITMISIFYKSPDLGPGVHIDVSRYNYRLLWPVKNCQGSYTRFFDLNGNKIITKYGKQGDEYKLVSTEFPLIEIAGVELVKPIVFNTQIPHGIFVNPDCKDPRITATIGFGSFPIEKLFNFE